MINRFRDAVVCGCGSIWGGFACTCIINPKFCWQCDQMPPCCVVRIDIFSFSVSVSLSISLSIYIYIYFSLIIALSNKHTTVKCKTPHPCLYLCTGPDETHETIAWITNTIGQKNNVCRFWKHWSMIKMATMVSTIFPFNEIICIVNTWLLSFHIMAR